MSDGVANSGTGNRPGREISSRVLLISANSAEVVGTIGALNDTIFDLSGDAVDLIATFPWGDPGSVADLAGAALIPLLVLVVEVEHAGVIFWLQRSAAKAAHEFLSQIAGFALFAAEGKAPVKWVCAGCQAGGGC